MYLTQDLVELHFRKLGVTEFFWFSVSKTIAIMLPLSAISSLSRLFVARTSSCFRKCGCCALLCSNIQCLCLPLLPCAYLGGKRVMNILAIMWSNAPARRIPTCRSFISAYYFPINDCLVEMNFHSDSLDVALDIQPISPVAIVSMSTSSFTPNVRREIGSLSRRGTPPWREQKGRESCLSIPKKSSTKKIERTGCVYKRDNTHHEKNVHSLSIIRQSAFRSQSHIIES